ncbi:MAG: hypothetical protein HQK63_12285 [Desulfamplus sp.]|nr:hypothetical protein [Desulfamplus sp.]
MKQKIKILSLTLAMVVFALPSLSLGSITLKDGLVAYYPFNGNANDESGNGNNGTVNGAVLTKDNLGNANSAYSFDGVNDYISVPYNVSKPLFSLENKFTYSLWFYANASGDLTNNQPLIGRQQCQKAFPSAELDLLKSEIAFTLNYQNSATHSQFIPLQTITPNQWTHIAATYDKDTNQVSVYLNGKNILSESYSQTIWKPETSFWIGGIPKPANNSSCWENFFKGNIDNIRVYNRSLSQSEIEEIYNSEGVNVSGIDPPKGGSVVDFTSKSSTAPVYMGSVVTGGDQMELSINFPAYNKAVDVWVLISTPDGKSYFVDKSANFFPIESGKSVPILKNISGVKSEKQIIKPFDVTSLGNLLDGKWTVYWFIAPSNNGDIVKAIEKGDYQLGFYTFQVNNTNTPDDPTDPNVPDDSDDPNNPDENAIESKTTESKDGKTITITLNDGTAVSIPSLNGGYAVKLEKFDNELAATQSVENSTTLRATGFMRHLYVTGSDDPSSLKPIITIPSNDVGDIDLNTVNILRVGDIFVNGELVKNYATTLPISVDEKGNLKFVDSLMPDGMLLPEESSSSKHKTNRETTSKREWVGNAYYIVMSFKDDLNWVRQPQLVRMVIDETVGESGGYRRPATSEELAKMAKEPICNVIILVHGHNEEEKEGSYTQSEKSPWLFSYKRRVWDLLYKEASAKDINGNALYPYQCTAFYEFIYPTYRPIFSPVSDKKGVSIETLGESLGRLIKEETTNNAQIKAMLGLNMPFNAFVVSHSQGGLVARSSFQTIPSNFKQHIKRFISWGSPHHGAALTTLRYALQAGHDMVVDGVKIPLQNFQKKASNEAKNLALDTPGTRDLRWDSSKKSMLNIREIFPTIKDDATEALISPSLYNENLPILNQKGTQDIPHSLIYGITTKSAELELADVNGGWWWQYRKQQVYKFLASSTPIEQGAALNKLMMKSGYTPNDGAVPEYSQKAEGIYGPDKINMGDISHEEFYGSEPAERNSSTIYKGTLTAQKTFSETEITKPSRSCPSIETNNNQKGDKISISGKVSFQIYDSQSLKVGQYITGIEAREGAKDGDVIDSFSFTFEDDGSFEGEAQSSDVPAGTMFIVGIFKDGSEVYSTPDSCSLEEGKMFTSSNVVRVSFKDCNSYNTIPADIPLPFTLGANGSIIPKNQSAPYGWKIQSLSGSWSCNTINLTFTVELTYNNPWFISCRNSSCNAILTFTGNATLTTDANGDIIKSGKSATGKVSQQYNNSYEPKTSCETSFSSN